MITLGSPVIAKLDRGALPTTGVLLRLGEEQQEYSVTDTHEE
jgi:hypothetical protein